MKLPANYSISGLTRKSVTLCDPGGSRTRDLRIKRSRPIIVDDRPHSADTPELGAHNPPIDTETYGVKVALPANSPPPSSAPNATTYGLVPRGIGVAVLLSPNAPSVPPARVMTARAGR